MDVLILCSCKILHTHYDLFHNNERCLPVACESQCDSFWGGNWIAEIDHIWKDNINVLKVFIDLDGLPRYSMFGYHRLNIKCVVVTAVACPGNKRKVIRNHLVIAWYTREVSSPDCEFIQSNCFDRFTRQVDEHDIPWEIKKEQMVWRGSSHVNEGYQWYNHGFERMHPRNVAVNLGRRPELSPFMDISFETKDIKWQLAYKLGTMVLRFAYIPVPSFYEVPRIYRWMKYNDAVCQQIVQDAYI